MGANASHGVPVYAPAFTGSCDYPQKDIQAEVTWNNK